jgi:DNA polymerase-3 subunit chi
MADGGAPCEVWFYHLERTALDQALPELLEKTLARGWRALVVSPAAERIEHLDGWLWSWRDDSFLPHGVAGEPEAQRQPVLLSTRPANDNGAQALVLIDGAAPPELAGYERCLILFDGNDEGAVKLARERWRELKGLGCPVSYWKQSDRGWEKSA